jgi:hypothetical protein
MQEVLCKNLLHEKPRNIPNEVASAGVWDEALHPAPPQDKAAAECHQQDREQRSNPQSGLIACREGLQRHGRWLDLLGVIITITQPYWSAIDYAIPGDTGVIVNFRVWQNREVSYLDRYRHRNLATFRQIRQVTTARVTGYHTIRCTAVMRTNAALTG